MWKSEDEIEENAKSHILTLSNDLYEMIYLVLMVDILYSSLKMLNLSSKMMLT